jgi:hypothetical protein
MTTQQHTQARGALIWNLFQWCKRRQEAKREGNIFSVEYCQQWIDDCRARVQRLDALYRGNIQHPTPNIQRSMEVAR